MINFLNLLRPEIVSCSIERPNLNGLKLATVWVIKEFFCTLEYL